MPSENYVRRARFERNNYDGDTIYLLIDQSRGGAAIESVRLLGIDTPELHRGSALEREVGRIARDFVLRWLLEAEGDWERGDKRKWPFVVSTFKSEKYGRLLTRVWSVDNGDELGRALLRNGLARIYLGGRRKPWPTEELIVMRDRDYSAPM